MCRSSEAKEPIEWQADYFAAALLMPRNRVRAAWEQWQGAATPVSGTRLWAEVDGLILADWFRYGTDPETIEDGLMESFCQPLAERFQVSAPAMRIRLEELELLTRSSCSIGR